MEMLNQNIEIPLAVTWFRSTLSALYTVPWNGHSFYIISQKRNPVYHGKPCLCLFLNNLFTGSEMQRLKSSLR